MTIPVLVSPSAGRGKGAAVAEAVATALRFRGLEPLDITGADATASLAAAHRVVNEGAERLIVVGGDGLVNLGLQAVAGSETILGVIPIGTGNDFVRGIDGFATDTETATEQALGVGHAFDAIQTRHGWVASVAMAGFSGDVNACANSLRWPKGSRRYSVATMIQLPRLASHEIELTVDGTTHHLNSVLIAVGNTAWFGGGMKICPEADPTDSMLNVTVVDDVGRIDLLRFFGRVFKGTHLDHPMVATHRGHEITIDSGDLDIWGDGELLGPAPVTLTAVPGALNLAC